MSLRLVRFAHVDTLRDRRTFSHWFRSREPDASGRVKGLGRPDTGRPVFPKGLLVAVVDRLITTEAVEHDHPATHLGLQLRSESWWEPSH